MFRSENASCVPNIINQTAEEDEVRGRSKGPRAFKDLTNLNSKIFNKLQLEDDPKQPSCTENSLAPQNNNIGQEQLNNEAESHQVKQQLSMGSKKCNLIIHFQSDEEEQEEENEKSEDLKDPLKSIENLDKQAFSTRKIIQEHPQQFLPLPPKKNNILLTFSDEDNQPESVVQQISAVIRSTESDCNGTVHEERASSKKESQVTSLQKKYGNEDKIQKVGIENVPNNKKLILDFQQYSSMSSDDQADSGTLNLNLTQIINKHQQKYYLQPIEKGSVMQCVIKRDKSEMGLKYHVYDASTLRNFITVIKDEDGYIFVSKYEKPQMKNLKGGKYQKIIGKFISNFFGTEFNCYLCDIPFKKNQTYPIDTQKCQKTITIQYETNLFGLKGPRKITAFIPKNNSGITGPKHLNQILASERKKSLPETILKFKNKSPRWNKQINAYVLNFCGRATISSIKNFIMIGQNQSEEDSAKVLFGKFGKQLFNLDIRYPYNIIQGLCLAMSAFDRKLACQ